MAVTERIKKGFEWLEHGKTLAEIILALGGGKAVEALLKQFTGIPAIWITPLWLLSSGVIMYLFILFGSRLRKPDVGQAEIAPPVNTGAAQILATAALAPPIRSPIDVEAFFHQSYSGQLQAEVEGNVRAMIQSRVPIERDDFVVRFIATGLVNVIYDRIWLTIFRSQITALMDLNQRVLRREEIKTHYDGGVQRSPGLYATYSFDQWLEYVRSQILMLEHPGQVYEITVRGKDFLKYMVHHGYAAENRFH